jgi:hypothetical protein
MSGLRGSLEPTPAAWRRRFGRPPLWLVVLLALSTWLVLDGLSPTGPILVLVSLAFGVVLFGLGTLILYPSASSRGSLLLAPGAGLIIASALAQFAASRGFSLSWTFWGIVVGSLPGLWIAVHATRRQWRRPVRHGLTIVALLSAASLVYFLPISLRDAVRTVDGGWQWVYVDTVFNHALAATLTTEVAPPRIPTFGTERLVYHFGPHALAASLSKGLGLDPADALMRVVRLLGLLALAAAVFTLGQRLAIRRRQRNLAGCFALFFVFFVGSVYDLLRPIVVSSAAKMPSVNWFTRQLSEFPAIDYYRHHLVVGSGLWGILAIFSVASLLARSRPSPRRLQFEPEFVLAPLAICLSTPAGLSLLAVVAGTHSRFHWRDRRFYALLGISLSMLAASLWLGGFIEPHTAPGLLALSTPEELRGKLIGMFKWLTLGLGIRALCFLNGVWARREVATSFWLFFAGYLLSYFLLHESQASSELYALLYLGALAGGYSAAPAAHIWTLWRHRRDHSTVRPPAESLDVDRTFVFLRRATWWLAGFSLVVIAATGFPPKQSLIIVATFALFASLVIALHRSRSSHSWRILTFAALGILVTVSSLAWWKTVELFTLNQLDMTVTADQGLVKSLSALRLSPGASLAATTHRSVPHLLGRPERSAMYAALSARPMLLEGWEYGSSTSPKNHATFEEVTRDNERLFESRDPSEVVRLARKYNVGYLLLEPGQTLGFDIDRAPQFRALPQAGTLTVLAIGVHGAAVRTSSSVTPRSQAERSGS